MIRFKWIYQGRPYTSRVEAICPFCHRNAVVRLPARIAAQQTDGTTHVCHPIAGGCNHGFARDVLAEDELSPGD